MFRVSVLNNHKISASKTRAQNLAQKPKIAHRRKRRKTQMRPSYSCAFITKCVRHRALENTNTNTLIPYAIYGHGMHNFSEIDLCKTGFIYIGVIFR
jgi:hypothetical protein